MNYSIDDNPNEQLKKDESASSSTMLPGMSASTLSRPHQQQQQQQQNFPSSGSINSALSSAEATTNSSTAAAGDEYENISHLHLQDGQWIVQNYENYADDDDACGGGGGGGGNNNNNNLAGGGGSEMMKGGGGGGTIDLAKYELSPISPAAATTTKQLGLIFPNDDDDDGHNNNSTLGPQLPLVPSMMAYGTIQDPMTTWASGSAAVGSADDDPVHKKFHTEQQPTSGVGLGMMEAMMGPAGSMMQQQQQQQHQEQQAQQYSNLFDGGTGGIASASAFQQQQQDQQEHEQHGDANFAQNINPMMPSPFAAAPSVDLASTPNVTNVDNINPAAIMDGSGETMLAREMAKLPVNEREKVTQDIHGVSDDAVVETEDLIQQKLGEIDRRLTELGGTTSPSSNSVTAASATSSSGSFGNTNNTNDQNVNMSAYNLAMSIDARYVTDAKFRIMFLRSCDFDVDRAAKRMAVHFDKKLELFGANKLCQTITQQDLNSDDHECLQSGQSQLLPYRDVSGRAVFFQALSHYKYKEVVNAMRTVYYILMSALEDEETQKKGIVCVVYNVEPRSALANDPRIYLNVYKLLPSIPMKMMGAHYCVQDAHLRQFMSSIRVAMSREVRLRSRVHHGSHQECIYALLTFGLPRRGFPILVANGELSTDKHREFLEMRLRQEDSTRHHTTRMFGNDSRSDGGENVPLVIVVPTNGDVLFGRGRPQQQNPGNVRCNYFVVANLVEYENASRNGKTVIARKVMEMIKSNGGRFLKQNDGVWECVPDTEALRKISHSFRTHRQLVKEYKERQESTGGVQQTNEKRQRPE